MAVMLEGKCVKRYQTARATVEIWDGAYAGKSEKELDAIRWEARRVACAIIDRAVREGRLDPVTGELLDPVTGARLGPAEPEAQGHGGEGHEDPAV